MLSPLLGLVFLGYPIRVILESDPTPMQVLLTLGGAALFAGVFLWLMWMHDPLPSAAAEPSEVRKRRAPIAFLAVLVIALNLVLGDEWRVLFFHVSEKQLRDTAFWAEPVETLMVSEAPTIFGRWADIL